MAEIPRDELGSLLESWVTHLRAERKSPHTIRTYTNGVTTFAAWCEQDGRSIEFTRPAVEAFTAALLNAGREAATALSRQRGVRHFTAWLAREGIAPDELQGMRPPKLDEKIPAEVSTAQLRALLATCAGREFQDLRDEAIIRLMVDSMVRADELLSMTMAQVNISSGAATVARGKGGRGRVVPFGPATARALDRYKRARSRHPLAARPEFWLGSRGRMLAYDGLYATLRRRAARAGFTLHPHQLRATGAIRWRAAGGSVPGLLTVAGWSSLDMAARYVRAAENRLAVEEGQRLHEQGLSDDL